MKSKGIRLTLVVLFAMAVIAAGYLSHYHHRRRDAEALRSPEPELEREVLRFQREANRQSLDIYGKVVDQHGHPVAGARIQGHVTIWTGLASNLEDIHYTTTDSSGRFNFVRLRGAGLGIIPQKEGYTYSTKLPSYRPDHYSPDPANPIVFTMWKLRGAEPLVHSKFRGRIPYDGRPVIFNLHTGEVDEDGDLQVVLVRDPVILQRGNEPFEWNVDISIVDGGIVETSGPYLWEAPESGYLPRIAIVMTRNDLNWRPDFEKMFYIRTRYGTYGVIDVRLSADSMRPQTGVRIEAWLNPSSRNLEYDPMKTIKPSAGNSVPGREDVEDWMLRSP